MRNEQQCKVMGEIALKYGGESLRQSNVYEKVRRTTMVRENLKAESKGEFEQIIEEDSKEEVEYLSEKVSKMGEEIKALVEEKQALIKELEALKTGEKKDEEAKEIETQVTGSFASII